MPSSCNGLVSRIAGGKSGWPVSVGKGNLHVGEFIVPALDDDGKTMRVNLSGGDRNGIDVTYNVSQEL